MATILSKPDELSLSGNLKPFKVSTSESLNFTLSVGTEILVNETYHPSDGIVEVDVKDVVISALSFVLQYNTSYVQPTIIRMFVASIDGVDYSFWAIRTGISNLADTPSNWLKGNFLTWQPKLKKVTNYTPEWITYFAVIACNIKVKAFFPNNTNETVTLQSCSAGNAYTLNMQYAVVSGLFSGKKPMYYEVAAYSGSSQLSYIQKYVVSDQISEDEQWILFENSLGGIDTFRAFGVTDFSGEHTFNSSIIDDVMEEYRIDTERLYTKNTGHLNKYERRWLLDFFPSRAKYIYQESAIHKIAVKESDVAYKSSDLPSSYTFTYCFADISPYLNLIRNEDELPANISIPVPDAPNFTIPPRLAEFPRVLLREGVVFPAFDPNSDDPTISTLGSISEYIRSLILDDLNGIIQSKPWIDPNAPLHSHSNKLIIDSITQGNIEVLSHLSIIEGRLKSDIDFWSVGEISAYGAGVSGGSGTSGSLGGLVNVGSWADEIPTANRVMVQLAGETHWSSRLLSDIAGLDTLALGNYLTSNQYATQSYVNAKVTELIGAAPTTLDTLNELATALGNDPNFATSMSTLIGTKWTQDNTKIANWNIAYSNNHTHTNKSVIDNLTQGHIDVLSHLNVVDGRIKVDVDFWSTGELSAYGTGSSTGGESGLISSVYGNAGLGGSYLNSDLNNTFNAYTINLINNNLTSALGRIGALETSTPNVAWGISTSQYTPLSINSVSRNLSLDGHTHSYLPLSGGSMSNTNVVTNFNSDLLDGFHAILGGSAWNKIPIVASDGVIEIGKYIDFHSINNDGLDYSTRLQAFGTSGNVLNLPTTSGTLAMLSDNVASATKLANVRTFWGQTFDGGTNVTGNITGGYFSIADNNSNPNLKLTEGANNWYLQGYQNKLYLGSGTSNSLNLDAAGNVGVVGVLTANRINTVSESHMSVGVYTDPASGIGAGLKVNGNFAAGGNSYFSGGNVLINTLTDAGYKLDVNGASRIFGGLHLNSEGWLNLYNGSNTSRISLSHNADVAKLDIYNRATGSWATIQCGNIEAQTISIYNDQTARFIRSNVFGGAIRLRGNSAAATDRGIQFGRVDNSLSWLAQMVINADSGNISIGTTTDSGHKLYVSGNIVASGEVTAYSASDIRLKTEVTTLKDSLRIIELLNPVSYRWNSIAKGLNPLKNDSQDFGLIAQELELVQPELVHTIYGGQYKSIDYVKLIPHLICAIKQLKTEMDQLKYNYSRIN